MTDIEQLKPICHTGTQPIQTQRLLLRRFRREDAGAMFQWASNPEVVRYLSYSPHQSLKESQKILKSWISAYRDPSVYNWAIEWNGTVIGNISVVTQDDACHTCHLGWQIDVPYWNQGIMTEAVRAVIDFLFDRVGYDRITSGHDTRNIGSGRVMQKAGMTLEGTFRRCCYQKDGSIGDKNYYAILRSEWENGSTNPNR
ncbi:MAG TPA: GNAT family N-acetyltransferase [Candidatus Onthovicinus excrementipullorum]|nr:GNAT family N-acetyltransferase [Candidatus Onthovicinus excrementipullorum]